MDFKSFILNSLLNLYKSKLIWVELGFIQSYETLTQSN